MYQEYLQNNLPEFQDEVQEIIENGMIPCKDCFFEKKDIYEELDQSDSFYSADLCGKCKGTGRRKIDNCWKLIMFLIDF